jgi:imidazoleglycerol-phosphate dehydratase / histidinol-phosphatase
MKKVLFLDRDGTLIIEPADEQIDSLEKLEFYPGIFRWLGKIARELDYEFVIVTNQDGLGTSSFPEQDFWPAQNKMINTFRNEGIEFSRVFIDRSLATENKPTRKPNVGLLAEFINGDYDLTNSYVIGDRLTDMQLAKNLGSRGILINQKAISSSIEENGLCKYCALISTDWKDVYELLATSARTSIIHRKTKETDVTIELNLNGSGNSNIKTGLGFFDHMLDQLSRHSGINLNVAVNGDSHIDEHHTIEDTALALGDAFSKALGDKRGIERYGYCLPMDDCLAQVAIDFGGRPWLVWDATFKREKIGEMPTEMFFHFFKSFSDAARCNLNVKADGTNEHHKIEAIFKAFAKSIKIAIRKEGNQLPTTKGILE